METIGPFYESNSSSTRFDHIGFLVNLLKTAARDRPLEANLCQDAMKWRPFLDK